MPTIREIKQQAWVAACEAYAAASDGRSLVADFADGFGVRFHFDAHAGQKLWQILKGNAGDVPVTVAVDPTYDTYPTEAAPFVGGPYDGRIFTVEDNKTAVTLVGGHRYVWDGKVFNYQKEK